MRVVTENLVGKAAVIGVALLLGACGIRGPLEAPPSATGSVDNRAQADSGQGKKENEAPKPHRGFILDGLIR
jgi:predicted small lipoprotein YifL